MGKKNRTQRQKSNGFRSGNIPVYGAHIYGKQIPGVLVCNDILYLEDMEAKKKNPGSTAIKLRKSTNWTRFLVKWKVFAFRVKCFLQLC